jgi:hypothetical protein
VNRKKSRTKKELDCKEDRVDDIPVTTNASIVPVMKRTRDLSQGPQVALISPALELFKALEFGVRFITGFMLALVGTGDVHANVTLIRLLRLHMIRTQQS